MVMSSPRPDLPAQQTTASHSSDDSLGPALVPVLQPLYSAGRGVLSVEPIALAAGQTGLGRETTRKMASIALPTDARVSRCHASLTRTGQRVQLRDEQSKNGTFRNGQRIVEAVLQDGDVLRLGDSFFVFRLQPSVEPAQDSAKIASLLGVSPAVQGLRRRLTRLATERATVLLHGESGTGKEVAARALHDLSRRSGAFVAVNCSALPVDLAESLLFGHTASAFSGAQRAEPGFFRAADRGTLLLDEIGDLPLSLQPKLLRALEERAVTPVGSTVPCRVDLRVVAASHRDLGQAVQRHEFRGDLYARLAEIPVTLPPLRDRREDILRLLVHALQDPAACLTPRLVAALLQHPFPFNIRELFKLATQLRVETPPGQPYDLAPIASRLQPAATAETSLGGVSPAASEPPPPLGRSDSAPRPPVPSRAALAALMAEHRGNVSQVARHMGRSRRQIDRWIETMGLDHATFRR